MSDRSLLERFNTQVAEAARLPHHRVLTRGADAFLAPLRDVYKTLTGTELPATSVFDVSFGAIDGAFLTDRGDGLMISHESRGFMAGMGQTITYQMVVAGDVLISVDDWWEDNIADPEIYSFDIRARTEELLERAIAALTAALDAKSGGLQAK